MQTESPFTWPAEASSEMPKPAASKERRRSPAAFRRILVAVDGSERAAFAVEAAGELAADTCADIVLVHVVHPEFVHAPVDLRADYLRGAVSLLDACRAGMPQHLNVETLLPEGDAAEEIVKAAHSFGADLIVMGTHGRGRIAKALLGSVTHSVTRSAACPVMTVTHAPATARAGACGGTKCSPNCKRRKPVAVVDAGYLDIRECGGSS